MYSKEEIIALFSLSQSHVLKLEKFLFEINSYNSITNIVGKSTMLNPWNRHILDSLQISYFIKNKKSNIIDMGTGAGIPGIILSIIDYKNISLIDSNIKKIKFLKHVLPILKIQPKIYHHRVESLKNKKYDFLISRALSNLDKLFFYSQNFLKNETVLIFLKGKKFKDEINEAKKNWSFLCESEQSLSDNDGRILVIRGLKRK